MDGWFFVTAFLAEIVGTLAGFGSSTILLPVALLFFDFKTALVLVAFMHLFGNIGRVTYFRTGLAWQTMLYFGGLGVIGTAIGALSVVHLDQELLKAYLGSFFIVYGFFMLIRPLFTLRPTKIGMIIGGMASGFLAGLIGTGGAIRSAFLVAYGLPKAQYIATAAAIAIAVDGTRIPLYISDGLLLATYYWTLPVLFVLAITGSYAGKRIASKIPQKIFKKIVLVCLVLAGGNLLRGYFFG